MADDMTPHQHYEQRHGLDETVERAYDFVEGMIDRADDLTALLWHGWALREAFEAGAEWERLRTNPRR